MKHFILVVLQLFVFLSIQAQEINKSVFVHQLQKLLKFTEWPLESSQDTCRIILFGNADQTSDYFILFDDFNIYEKETITMETSNINLVDGCHILIILEEDQQRVRKVVSKVENLPVLTVSSLTSIQNTGIIINFIEDIGYIPFVINRNALKKSGIYIDSILLSGVKTVD